MKKRVRDKKESQVSKNHYFIGIKQERKCATGGIP